MKTFYSEQLDRKVTVPANEETKVIAGHEITLDSGQWYIATRPMMNHMANRFRPVWPVSIWTKINAQFPAATVDGLTWDEANEFLNEFNNGETSFDGRCW